MLAILEAQRVYSTSFEESLMVESDSSNSTSWVSGDGGEPWNLLFYLNDIKSLSSHIKVEFQNMYGRLRIWGVL